MHQYSMVQWLFIFYFYCFFGWCFESAYVSIKERKLVNRGFIRGPFLPLYGSGAIMMLLVSRPFQQNLLLVFVAGCLGATVLEYVTGVAMEALFKVRYWDYSKNKFNFQGHICLGTTLSWGILTILMTQFIHKPVEILVLSIPGNWLTLLTFLLTALVFSDFALSFKAALDLKDILVQMERAKLEMLRIQKRLDIIIAVSNEEITNKREEIAEGFAQYKEDFSESIEMHVEDIKNSIEEKLEGIRRMAKNSPGYWEGKKEEIGELLLKYRTNADHRNDLRKGFWQKNIIRANPTMSSKKFKEALEELKRWSEKKKGD